MLKEIQLKPRVTDVDKAIEGRLIGMKIDVDSGLKRTGRLLKKLENDVRDSGIGSDGGHIAREIKTPGPHNGHTPNVAEMLLLHTGFIANFHSVQLYSGEEVVQPDWNHRFGIRSNQLVPIRSKTANIKTKKIKTSLRNEIRKYKSKSINEIDISAQQPKDFYGLKLLESDVTDNNSISNSTWISNTSQEYEVRPMRSSIDLNKYIKEEDEDNLAILNDISQQLWASLIHQLRKDGFKINYNDLVEINQYASPPSIAVDVFGYICVIVGNALFIQYY